MYIYTYVYIAADDVIKEVSGRRYLLASIHGRKIGVSEYLARGSKNSRNTSQKISKLTAVFCTPTNGRKL